MPQRTVHRVNRLGIASLLVAALLLGMASSNGQTGRRRNEPAQSGQRKPAIPEQTPTQEQIPKPTAPWLLASPNPLNVKPVVSQQHQVIQHISADLGGTIEAQGADGTLFTLTIPKGALAEDLEIAITPVSAIENLPFSRGLIAAVQIAPSDVSLARAATLTIEPAKPLSIPEQIMLASFAYHEGGKELYLYPLEADPSKVKFKLIRGGGFGVAHGTDAEEENVRRHIPTDPAERLFMQIQKLNRLLRQRRLRQTTGQAWRGGQTWRMVTASLREVNSHQEPTEETMLDVFRRGVIALREMYHQQVIPQLKALKFDCRSNMLLRVRETAHMAEGWKRGVDLLELRSEQTSQDVTQGEFEAIRVEFQKLYDDLDSLIDDVFRRAYERAYQCCLQEGKPYHLQMMDAVNRMVTLRGLEDFTSLEKRAECACTVASVSSQAGTWLGEITHTDSYDDNSSETISGNNQQRINSLHRKLDYKATITLEYNFRSSDLSSGLPVQIHAVGGEMHSSGVKVSEPRCTLDVTTDFSYSGSTRENIAIQVVINPDGTYRVNYTLPCIQASGPSRAESSLQGPNCSPFAVKNHNWIKNSIKENPVCPTAEGTHLQGGEVVGIQGRIDPKNPKELSGTATMTEPLEWNKKAKRTIVIKWHLTRCR